MRSGVPAKDTPTLRYVYAESHSRHPVTPTLKLPGHPAAHRIGVQPDDIAYPLLGVSSG
jgi:hypothetical protein